MAGDQGQSKGEKKNGAAGSVGGELGSQRLTVSSTAERVPAALPGLQYGMTFESSIVST